MLPFHRAVQLILFTQRSHVLVSLLGLRIQFVLRLYLLFSLLALLILLLLSR